MAITFIYPIKATGEISLEYDTEVKRAKIVEKKNDSKDSLVYVMRDKKGNTYKLSDEYMEKMKNYISYDDKGNVTFHTVKRGLHCCVDNAYKEWELVRQISNNRRNNKGNLQYCIVQNFGIDLDPMIANKIGMEFAEKYLSDYQCVVSTHINTGNVHNHIEFNATSFVTGKKFNDDLKAIRDIRKVSDELCKKYELDVLEETKNFNYVIYKDANGTTKVYEPTDRKNQISDGEYANKNDYRNTEKFKQSTEYTEVHFNELRKDIERFLPYAISYEDLLQQLRNAGYEIKDKSKSGEWRKHISFKASTWDRFTRDSSLGEDYEREHLTNAIADNVKSGKVQTMSMEDGKTVTIDDVKKSDVYVYGRIVIEDIDEEYRHKKKKSNYENVKRSNIEKYIITDIKRLNKDVNTIMRQSMFPQREHIQKLAYGTKKEQYLIDRINSNLKTLRFVEDRDIRSFEQINDIVKTLYEKRNACYNQLNMIFKALKRANADVVLIDKYNYLNDVIATNEDNPDYALYENENDTALLKSYESALRQKDLLSISKQNEFKKKYEKYNGTFLQLSEALERVNKDIREYDDCIFNLNAVDKNNGNRFAQQIATYYSTKDDYKQSDKQKNEKER